MSRFHALAAAAFAVIGLAQPGAADTVLTSVPQILALSPSQRLDGRPVHIRGTVLDCALLRIRGDEYPTLYVHDGQAGIYVAMGNRRVSLRAGDLVEITGRTTDAVSPVIRD